MQNDVQKKFTELRLKHCSENIELMLEQAKQLNNDRNFFNNILLVEGDIYTSLEKYEIASKNYNSLIINTDIYEKEYLATRAYLGLAELHFKTAEFDLSVSNGEEALKLAEANSFFKEIFEANVQLTDSYEALGSFDLALDRNRELLKINDSIFNIEKIKHIVKILLFIGTYLVLMTSTMFEVLIIANNLHNGCNLVHQHLLLSTQLIFSYVYIYHKDNVVGNHI